MGVRIENWCLIGTDTVPICVPGGRLFGQVYGHPFHPDGKEVCTSVVRSICGRHALTASREYELGRPSDTFGWWYEKLKQKTLDLSDPNWWV
jgi:hypothetical protein